MPSEEQSMCSGKSEQILKKIVYFIKMVNLSLIELKQIAKYRGIKIYEKMSEDKLLNALNASRSIKTIIEIN